MLFFFLGIMACRNGKESKWDNSDGIPISVDAKEENVLNFDSLVDKLQGEWKEPKYPFRRVIFKNNQVKFIEEGVIEPPKFREYQLANSCGEYKSKTSKNIYFYISGKKRCEVIEIIADSLKISGAGQDYNILYL